MAGSLNKVMLIGNLGKDPEIKTFEGGNSLARFPIATSESYNNRAGEKVTQTEWHTVVLRTGLAGVAEKYLKKGDQVFIEGKIKTRSWEDQQGERKYVTEIHGDNMTMLGSPKQEQNTDTSNPAQSANPSAPKPNPSMPAGDEDDDLPF
jgi:single-strand DNA-binding protein